jgi:hypothetical protein
VARGCSLVNQCRLVFLGMWELVAEIRTLGLNIGRTRGARQANTFDRTSTFDLALGQTYYIGQLLARRLTSRRTRGGGVAGERGGELSSKG